MARQHIPLPPPFPSPALPIPPSPALAPPPPLPTSQDLNPAYSMLLRSELLGSQCPSPISPDKHTALEQLKAAGSPAKKILRFRWVVVWVCVGGGGEGLLSGH
jgi:hypothetical protein